MQTFKDKVIIITGAGSGIGRALAEHLGQEGGVVVVTNRTGNSARAVAEGIRLSGGRATAASLDVTNVAAVQRLVDETVLEYGRLDYIFNNAGISIFAEAKDHTLEDWAKTLGTNLNGVIHGVHAAYPVMRRQGFGHIVNMASIAGLVPGINEVAYAASKYAVVGLSTSLRAEAEAYGVKVSVVCPGFVDTPMLFEKSTNKYADRMGLASRDQVKQLLGVSVLPADAAARAICRGVAKNRGIVLVTRHARLLYLLNRFSPSLVLYLSTLNYRKVRELYR